MLDAAASGPSQGPGTVCQPQGRRHCQGLRGRTALAIRCPQSDCWAYHMSTNSLAVAGTSSPLLPRKQDLSSVSPYPQPNGPGLPAASGLQGSSQGQRPSPTHVLLGDPPQPPCLTLWALTHGSRCCWPQFPTSPCTFVKHKTPDPITRQGHRGLPLAQGWSEMLQCHREGEGDRCVGTQQVRQGAALPPIPGQHMVGDWHQSRGQRGDAASTEWAAPHGPEQSCWLARHSPR